MIVEWELETGFGGEIELPDDVTEEEIEEAVKDEAWNYIELGWAIKEDNEQN